MPRCRAPRGGGSLRDCGEPAGWPRAELLRRSAQCGTVRTAQFEEGRDSTGQGAGSQPGAARRRKVQQRADRRWAGPCARSQARVKRCGKSAPSLEATPTDRQTPPGARPSRDRAARLMIPGRPLRWMATPTAAADGQNPAYRPAHRPGRLRCYRFSVSDAEVGRVVERVQHGRAAAEADSGYLSLGNVHAPTDLVLNAKGPPHCRLDR